MLNSTEQKIWTAYNNYYIKKKIFLFSNSPLLYLLR